MKTKLIQLAVAVAMAVTAPAFAADAMHPIYSVVKASTLDCGHGGGGAELQWVVTPARDVAWKTGLLAIADTGYEVDFRAIPAFKKWTAVTNFHAKDRGVDDSYVLFTKTGLAPFETAYVVTTLPESMRGDPKAMDAVLSMEAVHASGAKTIAVDVMTPFGPGKSVVAANRTGSSCFPTADYVIAAGPAVTMGISDFVIRGNHLIEYSLVLPMPAGTGEEKLSTLRRMMAEFQAGLRVASPER